MDAILGPSATPTSLAHAGRDRYGAGVPFGQPGRLFGAVIEPPEGNRRWAFKLIPSERVATVQIVGPHASRTARRRWPISASANALGDGYIKALDAQAS